jgi:hypothetical protein
MRSPASAESRRCAHRRVTAIGTHSAISWRGVPMIACHAPNLLVLIERAQSDLFAGVAKEQRQRLAEAWANFRRAAALLGETDHGRVPVEQLREALAGAQAGIEALEELAGSRRASGEA